MASNRVADLTVDELRMLMREEMRGLIRETVQEVLDEMSEEDPDAGLKFRPEIEAELEEYMREKPKGRPAHEIMKELGLLDDE